MITEKQFITMLGLVIVPQVAELIARDSKLTEVQALRAFLRSKTYSVLEVEDSKAWNYSPMALFAIRKSEQDTGAPEWPTEGLLA